MKAERGIVVFANAAAGSQLPLGTITAEQIDEIFDTNVEDMIFTVRKAPPPMDEAGVIIPLQRMADPAAIGAVAAFLASHDSSFMTAGEVAARRRPGAVNLSSIVFGLSASPACPAPAMRCCFRQRR